MFGVQYYFNNEYKNSFRLQNALPECFSGHFKTETVNISKRMLVNVLTNQF
jgi:hypothetical protein